MAKKSLQETYSRVMEKTPAQAYRATQDSQSVNTGDSAVRMYQAVIGAPETYRAYGNRGQSQGNSAYQKYQSIMNGAGGDRAQKITDWANRYSRLAKGLETGYTQELVDEADSLAKAYNGASGVAYAARRDERDALEKIYKSLLEIGADGKKHLAREKTASGLLPEDLAGLQQKRAEYQKQLDGLARKPTPYAVRGNISTPEGYAAALQNNKGLPEVDRQIQDLQGKIGDIDSLLTIYNRIDKFGDDVTAKYAGGNSMEAREAWRNGKDEREQTFREKERELRQDSTPYAARESAASGDAYAAALSNPQDSGFTARRDAYKTEDDKRIIDRLDEYLTWFDGLSEESQRRIKSSDVNGQNPYRDFEIAQNDPGYQNKHWGQMTEDERNAVFQIANTEGTYAAAKYLEDLQMTLDRRQTLAMEQNEKDRAEKTPVIGDMLRGVATVPGNLIGAPVSFIGNVIDKAQGKGFNPYSNANFLLNQSGAVREASSQEVYKAIAGDGSNEFMNLMGQAASNAYQAGLSALDSLAGMATMGKFYTVSMGMGAASQRMRELVESGASDKEIMTGAILSGIAEAFFEYVSLDKFGDQWIEANPAKFIRKALIQAGVEGSEEVFTELANQLIDSINRGVNSDHERRIRALMGDKDNPMSREEAARQAMFEDTMDVIWAGLGGAFSGGLMSVGGLAYDLPRAYEGGVRIAENGSPSEVVNTALELHEDNKTAQRLQERLNGTGKGEFGSRKSDYRQLYRVSLQNAAEMTGKDVSAVRGGIEERLTELNVPNGGKTVASAIVNRLTGKSLSVSERLALAKNQEAAQTVLNEIYSVAEGGATGENAWVRKIGTFKLAPGTFGKAETQTEKAARESMDASLKENFGDKASAIATLYDEGQNRDKFTQEMLTVYHAGQDGRDLASVPEGVTNQSQRLTAYVMGAESVNSMESFSYEDGQSRLKSDGTPVNVVGFASTGRNAAVALDDGGTAKASDVVFATLGEARLYKVVADMGIGTEAANGLLKAARESRMNESTFAVSLYEAYQQGASGVAFDAIPSSSESMRLGESARRTAWEAGRKAALEADAKKQAKMDSGRHGKKSGSLTVEESAKAIGKRSAQQESAMHAAELLSRMGLDITVFASTKEEQAAGMENGSISLADGSIRVDLNAGADGQGVMAYALSHEFTHFVEEMSPQKFRAFTDILFAEMGKSQVDVKSLIDGKMAVLKAQNEGLSESELRSLAYSEVVAEMMETAMTDTDVLTRISAKIKKTDSSLWGKIKNFLQGLVEKLKSAYKGLNPDSAIARLAKETIARSEAVLEAFSDAAADAVMNYNLQETAKENGLRYSDGTFTNRNGESVDYLKSARITDKETLDFLNDQEMVTTYKTMQLVDGKLYPPMAAVIQGSYEDASELGKWEMAVEHPELIKDVNGKAKFTLNKGKGQGSLAAAYNPYMHSSNLVLNDQFSGAYLRPNLVTVECKVPVSELTSGYKAQYAKDSVGWHSWHTGTVAGALRQQTGVERKVLLSRYIMPVRILSNAEVAGMYAELLNGTGIAVPDNVVPPALLAELEKAGVEIAESGRVKYSSRTGKKFSYQYFSQKQDVTITDIDADVGIDRKTIRNAGITSALNVGSRNKYGAVDVYVNDIGSNVVVGKDGISHGLRRENKGTPSENYIVAANAGPILKNSILINELTPKNENADGSYVLVGIAKDQYNTGYVVESIVNKFTNKLESMDVLYSMNAKKELAALNAPRATPKALPVTSSDYTVPSVLNLVKEHFPDILPEDVLKHYGYESRPDGKLGESVLYSARQETKNLVALHNLTEEKLLKSLELGGFPMPSIAITKADIPHTNFGDITVVFGKETIDPKARRENTVYSADAWTPVVPRVEYEADSKVTDRVYNRLGALKNQVAEYFQHDLDTLRYSLEDRLNRDGGEAGILENLRNNYALKAAFLEEQGTHIEQQTKQVETAVNSISSEMEDKLLNVWEALGKPTPDEIGSTSMKEIRDTYGSELEKAYPGMTKSAFRMSTVLGKLRAYLSGEANATKTSVVADGEAMKKAVDAAVDQGAFERWARELFSGIEKSKGVYNGKERFTPSGNLRSFKATHIPATLEGIVQAMRSENGGNTKNVSGFSGVKTLRAATAEEFGSIADMHRAEGRLQNLTEEQVSQIQDKLGDRLYKLMNDIDAANTKARWSDNLLIRMDSIGENLTEIGESGRYTPENVKRVFAKYGMEVSDHTAQEVVQLLFDISQMPVNIFEAKPKRAVRFEEIRNVLVPDTASQKLLRELDNRGIPYQVYEAGNEAQRQQMVSQMDDVRFSSRAQQDSEYLNLAQNSEENREVLSRMVENAAREAGYTRLFFHGSKKGGGFTVFRDWQYFTENREYAKRYANRENPGSLYETYVKMENPFDTRIPEVRELFEQARQEYGMGELQENGLPDWTDGYDIADYIDENDLPYDGIILDEGGDMVNGKPVSRGLSYVIRDSSQVKSADAVTYDDNGNVIPLSQRFDTGKEDIRYSARNPQAQVEAENERLKTELEYLKKLVQIQKRGNKDFTLDRNSVKRQALELMRGNNATGKSSELTEILDGVYRYIGTDTELTWEGFAEKADAAADWILEHQRFQRDAYAQEVLNWMGKQRFRLNEAQVEEAKYRFGSLNEFQKQIRGTFVLDQSSKTGLDQLWQEAAEMYPDQFSEDTTAPDMPGALADLVQSLQGMEDTEAAYRKSDTDVRGELIQQIYDRYWNVEPVKSVSDKAAKQIDRLKAEHREAIRELKEENRDVKKELNNALREYRRQRNEEFKTMKAEYKSQLRQVEQAYRRQTSQLEGVTDKVERDKRTELRGKTFRAMNAINRMLLNPGKTLYVPDSLQPAVIRFMQGLTGEIQKSPKGTLELRGNLESLQAAYANLANLNKGVISPEIHEGVAAMLSDAMDAIGNMEFKNLNREQLTEVYNAVKSVLHTIRNANKMYAENLRGTYGELADLTYREFSMQESREKVTGAFREQADTLSWNMEKPVYAAMRLGSDTMLRLYQNLRSGEDTWARDFREARAYAVGTMAKYNYDKFTDKIVTLTDRNGKKVGLNLEERMSLYACARREQAVQHLTKGGFVLSSRETRSVKNRLGIRLEQRVSDFNTYVLGEGQAEAIRGKDNILELTDGQKAFADAMQDYLSTVCGEKNNEISRELYGVSLAKEKNYWPIRSSGMFSEIIRNRQENPGNRQKNAGHMKATNAYARNAIELSGFMDTWASAVDATNMYHAFTLPMEDFMKVWNWKDTERNVSMRQVVLEKHGNAAVQYFDTFMKDLNKGVRTDPRAGAMNRMLGNFKKGAVSFSLSVAIQQPSAVGRAFAFIHPKYFTGSKVESVKGIQETWEIMQKYAPVVTLKDVGRFDMDMGRSTTDILTGKAEKGVTGFIDKIGGVMPEFMDKITWIAMWEAAKRQVKAENHSLSGEALLRKAGELFTKTVTETQVYDSVFSRNGLMRSQDVMAKAATAFMAEPATTANMVMKAMRDAKNKNFRAAGRTLASVGAATLLNSLLASLVYASRDDDEDMPWIERYLKSFVGEIIDGMNPLGYIPVVKDLWSIFQGYDVIRSDVSQWADLYKATTKFVNAWEKYGSTDKEDAEARREALKASGKASADMTAAILNLFGIPLRNVLREIRAIGNVAKEIAEPREGDRHTRGYALWNGLNDYMPTIFRADTSKKRELYRAVTSGSAAWVDRMKAGYDTEDKFNTAVVNALRENDRRVLEAAKASASGDEDARDRLVEEIAGEGKFTKEQVEEAVEKQIKKLPGAKYDALLDAVRNGGDVQGEMDALGKYGYSKDQMENKIQSSVKEWYQDGIVSKQDAQKMLDAYAGETSRGAESLVKKWSSKVTVGIEFSEISDEYLAGNMTASRAVEMYMLYGGYTREDAEELVRQWGAEKDLGIKYSALGSAYVEGEISESTLRSALMKYGGKDKDEADTLVRVYSYKKAHPNTELSTVEIEAYTKEIPGYGKSLSASGISETAFLQYRKRADACEGTDKNGDGRTDSGSKKAQILAVIDSLPISAQQKDALYYANKWSSRELRKAPWH